MSLSYFCWYLCITELFVKGKCANETNEIELKERGAEEQDRHQKVKFSEENNSKMNRKKRKMCK